jgi:hypothetical protein
MTLQATLSKRPQSAPGFVFASGDESWLRGANSSARIGASYFRLVTDEVMPELAAPTGPDGRTLRGLVLYFLTLGSAGFGGPIALVGYMHRDLVEDRQWFTEGEFQQGMAVARMMPGPLAARDLGPGEGRDRAEDARDGPQHRVGLVRRA